MRSSTRWYSESVPGPVDRTGVEDFVAFAEEGRVPARRDHGAGGIETEDLRRLAVLVAVAPQPDVDRVDRDRLDLDQQVARAGLGDRQLEVDQ